MEKHRMTKVRVVLSVAVLLALGFIAAKAAEDSKKQGKECTMMDMQKCMMKCMANCEKNMQSVSDAIASLDKAVNAIDVQNTADAKKEIEKAKKALKDLQEAQKACMAKMPTCNATCPISGKQIDMMDTPGNLTRMYKGKKVGFCSPACPIQWEQLSEKDKDEKFEKSMPKMPETEKMMKDKPGEMKM